MSDAVPTPLPDVPFTDMAARIVRNAPADFGGAFVIVPPGGGDPVSVLMLDGGRDVGVFWASVGARLQVITKQLQEVMERQRTGFGMR